MEVDVITLPVPFDASLSPSLSSDRNELHLKAQIHQGIGGTHIPPGGPEIGPSEHVATHHTHLRFCILT